MSIDSDQPLTWRQQQERLEDVECALAGVVHDNNELRAENRALRRAIEAAGASLAPYLEGRLVTPASIEELDSLPVGTRLPMGQCEGGD